MTALMDLFSILFGLPRLTLCLHCHISVAELVTVKFFEIERQLGIIRLKIVLKGSTFGEKGKFCLSVNQN